MTRYSKPASINAQISDTEQQILNHQQAIDSCTTELAGKIQQQMVTPANLLLAASIGFIAGELTLSRSGKEDKPPAAASLLSLMATARTLLPLALMIKSYFQPVTSDQTDEGQTETSATKRTASLNDE
jgi:hypothetical protein